MNVDGSEEILCADQTVIDLLTVKDRDENPMDLEHIVGQCTDCNELLFLSAQYFVDDETYTSVESDGDSGFLYVEKYIYRKWD